MRILAIETSCDETAIAIINAVGDPRKNEVEFDVLADVVLSQVKLHKKYGGVFPSLAKREHAKNLIPLLKQALAESNFLNIKAKTKNKKLNAKRSTLNALLAREPGLLQQLLGFIPNTKKPDIDAIAVTYGPGLEPALWVGVNFAKALSLVWNVPVIPVNHMEGHIFSALLKRRCEKKFSIFNFQFPIVSLLISGGHTELVLSKKWLNYKIVGETKDDAVGEAFDKVARMLGLPYPGGPEIGRKAARFQRTGRRMSGMLPRPMINSGDFNFSFSGLKTAVLYRLKEHKKLTPKLIAEFSHEFQEAVTEVLVKKTIAAAKKYKVKTIIVGGGVSANKRIRDAFVGESRIMNHELRIFLSPLELTGDNALMIAVAGYIRSVLTKTIYKPRDIKATGTLRLF